MILLVVSVTAGVLIDSKEIAQFVGGEMSFDVLLLIDDATAQRFLVRLPLEDLLLECARLNGGSVLR